MLVQQILKSKADATVFTVPPGTLVSEAAEILAEKRIGTVIVSADGGKTAMGILSERDIVRELAKTGGACLSEKVEAYMTSDLETATRDEKADTILARMTEGRFRHMPVIEGGELVGLITLGDVVKARLSELAMEKDALEGMIMGH
ncbi:MAG: CBS domain-containing protein [Marinovum algicola]|jgi:CBS domain-containing protein|uniref:CBS domain-containing protein n=1 Tax=Marinovum algicola TaxID=42444 RepID=A0A975ZMR2_9RHOB|nr:MULTISPECIES: CBS domain-containing protein [Marinovum]AKO97125.1 putative signal-transduction protein [Marinovum algicola DG 898]MDD9739920.1 CBS domain-containing protein [Marinovum sp. SP66]MDD9742511.1 CBS domain-containing protein [Marinovum sp. PR37]SEJ14027.1 CBS domain-containing protein [Marinovum algicola]SLN21857.1 inosine 5'-monophosphate dehydrogenase [Marinovum algicola]